MAVDDDEIEHLGARIHLDAPARDLLLHRLIATEKELLTGLPPCVESPRYLSAAKGSVVQQATVLARERDSLRNALVDDVQADLREAVHVRLARSEVAALYRVIEEPPDAVAVVLVVLCGVDSAL